MCHFLKDFFPGPKAQFGPAMEPGFATQIYVLAHARGSETVRYRDGGSTRDTTSVRGSRLLTADTFGQVSKLETKFLKRTVENRLTGWVSSRVDRCHAHSKIEVERPTNDYNTHSLLRYGLNDAARHKNVDSTRHDRIRRHLIGALTGCYARIAPIRRQQRTRVFPDDLFKPSLALDKYGDIDVDASFDTKPQSYLFFLLTAVPFNLTIWSRLCPGQKEFY